MHVNGSEGEQEATKKQLEHIYHNSDGVIDGGMARAAMYEHYGYADAPDFDLHSAEERSGYRDIDLIGAHSDESASYSYGPESGFQHPIDTTLANFVRRDEETGEYSLKGVTASGERFSIPLDPLVMQPVERTLLGTPIRTLPIGTRLHMGELLNAGNSEEKREKAEHDAGIFATFAATVDNPDEFLPAEYYEPFEEFKRRHAQ